VRNTTLRFVLSPTFFFWLRYSPEWRCQSSLNGCGVEQPSILRLRLISGKPGVRVLAAIYDGVGDSLCLLRFSEQTALWLQRIAGKRSARALPE